MLANCAAMNIPPAEAERLTLAEYQGLLWHWNDMHTPESDKAKDAPAKLDPDMVRRSLAMANMRLH